MTKEGIDKIHEDPLFKITNATSDRTEYVQGISKGPIRYINGGRCSLEDFPHLNTIIIVVLVEEVCRQLGPKAQTLGRAVIMNRPVRLGHVLHMPIERLPRCTLFFRAGKG